MGATIAMLEKHYRRLEVIHKADVLAGQQDESFTKLSKNYGVGMQDKISAILLKIDSVMVALL